jgi:hypothetical protein
MKCKIGNEVFRSYRGQFSGDIEDVEKPQSEEQASGQLFKLATSRIHSGSSSHSTATFGANSLIGDRFVSSNLSTS